MLDNPSVVAGRRRVLDLGAGSGLVGIAAARAGACEVIEAEVDRYAVAALELNAKLNKASISVLHGDLTHGPPPEIDMILVGDLFYAPDLSERVTAFLDRCSACGIRALIGDPLAGASHNARVADNWRALWSRNGRRPRYGTERAV